MTKVGTIISADLTVENADEISDFYKKVVGWKIMPLEMEDDLKSYSDYVMLDGNNNWTAGVCHKRGANADQPSGWIVYVHVEDIAASKQSCVELGGKVLKENLNADGTYQSVTIADPTGAVLALTQSDTE